LGEPIGRSTRQESRYKKTTVQAALRCSDVKEVNGAHRPQFFFNQVRRRLTMNDRVFTYRIFCPESETDKLPAEIAVQERYPAFVIASASREAVASISQRYPVEELKGPKAPPDIPDVADIASTIIEGQKRGPYYLAVRFRAPVRQQWIDELVRATGCVSLGAIGSSTIVVRCTRKTSINDLQRAPTVGRVSPYVPQIGITTEFAEGLQAQADEADIAEAAARLTSAETKPRPSSNLSAPGVLIAGFFTREDQQKAKRGLRRRGIRGIHEAGSKKLAINLMTNSNKMEAIQAVAALIGLRSLEEKKIKKLFNDVARIVIGDRIVTPNPDSLGLTGRGEAVAVADSGLDTGDPATIHADFRGRIKHIQSFPMVSWLSPLVNNPSGDDGPADIYSGHGTHVCGSILGNGARSTALGLNPVQGMAPEAELVFQAIEQTPEWNLRGRLEWLRIGRQPPRSGLYGIPEDLQELFQLAFDQNARIHSNSWGGGEPGEYDQQCQDVDEFVWEHKDFLVLFAAGNDGKDTNPRGQGIDPMSVTSPGTAKNCLTIGACENDRSAQFTDTYGEWWPDDFPNTPFRSDRMIDSVDDIVAFSSRGPCATGRQKPDVIAPGTFILSTRSSQIPSNNFAWGSFPPAKNDYMYMGGTSMATPLVAGCAALARQYLRQTVGIENPSAALLKATIIHCAIYQQYRFARPDSAAWVDNEQGWGRVDLQRALNPQAPTKVIFIEGTQGLQTGDFHEVKVVVDDSSVPLRITMVYNDFPGEDLINNLNLFANDPAGSFFVGNDFRGMGMPDPDNNVEGIVFENPSPGTWSIQVVGSNVPEGPQDFALVISGGGIKLL
jgi:serine protease AprX